MPFSGKNSACCPSSVAVTCQSELSNTEIANSPFLEDDIERMMEFFNDDDTLLNDGTGNDKRPDPSIVKGTVETPVLDDGFDIYNGLEDLKSCTRQQLTDNFLLVNNPGDDFFLNQTPAGDLCYLELDDLAHPLNFPEGVTGAECSQVQNHVDHYQSCNNVGNLRNFPSAPSNTGLPSWEGIGVPETAGRGNENSAEPSVARSVE